MTLGPKTIAAIAEGMQKEDVVYGSFTRVVNPNASWDSGGKMSKYKCVCVSELGSIICFMFTWTGDAWSATRIADRLAKYRKLKVLTVKYA